MELEHLFSAAESRELDLFTIQTYNLPPVLLMGMAGAAVLTRYSHLFPVNNTIILCGSGNNGGDGLVIAWLLINSGHNVQVYARPEGNHSEEYNYYLNLLNRVTGIKELADFTSFEPASPTLVVDCLLGTGFQPELKEPYISVIRHLNKIAQKANTTVMSIDTPSGYYPGNKLKNHVLPDYLAEIGTRKTENIFYPYDTVQTVLPIGFPVSTFKSSGKFFMQPLPLPELQERLQRENHSNKYANGSLAVIGGSQGMSGAAIIAQKAFHIAGGGISKIYTPAQETINAVLAGDPSMMAAGIHQAASDPFIKKSGVLIAGPGLNPDDCNGKIMQQVTSGLKKDAAVILDAGALELHKDIDREHEVLLTPHTGEFNRLTGTEFSNPLERIAHQAEYCKKNHVNILLKDYVSVYCGVDGVQFFFAVKNDKLAVMGSGDMLTGYIARFIAAGYSMRESVHYALSLATLSKLIDFKYPTVNEILEETGKLI